MRIFQSKYGSTPFHLLGIVITFTTTGYAFFRVFQDPVWYRYLIWFVGAALLHDLVFAPFYILLDKVFRKAFSFIKLKDPGAINYLRVPGLLSGMLLLMFLPIITQGGERAFKAASGKSQDIYLTNWLVLTLALFALSGIVYLVQAYRAQAYRKKSRSEGYWKIEFSKKQKPTLDPKLDEG